MKNEKLRETIKVVIILIITAIWTFILLENQKKKNEKQLKIYRLQNQHLINELDSLSGLIERWEVHHQRLAIYAKEWDSTHTR